MKVLVTGADGFIGSHLVERLVAEGVSVKALAYYNSFSSWGWLDTVDKSVMRKVKSLLEIFVMLHMWTVSLLGARTFFTSLH